MSYLAIEGTPAPLDWFQLMEIFVGFFTKTNQTNQLFEILLSLRVTKLMNVLTRISVVAVVNRVILLVTVLMPGALGPLMSKILYRRALQMVPTLVMRLIVMLIKVLMLRVPRPLSMVHD